MSDANASADATSSSDSTSDSNSYSSSDVDVDIDIDLSGYKPTDDDFADIDLSGGARIDKLLINRDGEINYNPGDDVSIEDILNGSLNGQPRHWPSSENASSSVNW